MTNNEWEICKLAADERYDGHGAGSAVFKACMDYALENGANKLTILSNSILKPACIYMKNTAFMKFLSIIHIIINVWIFNLNIRQNDLIPFV